ncbi:Spx/MgsR family RNA polymerase-binding regulatory protein [Mucilaginibacter arboris]|uniref:Spx/MgsR family RNA polymerase-binding regulatory protein n=1 Tax=Mucilaginibacter arboris TaxID=2682090 RepID=A0A7K1T181_9SPHI|nr:Spx/MgsR family RNA polymerase-binding regulatory protein [Mucilaginibacter arboris]MVN23333.1 Spx/MgsR family RNA polymerase-binding regulatory protein [Mucilaginibacter arboris]
MKIYGIKNCNTVKKALDWLKENNVGFEFHDFKKEGVSLEKLQDWSSKVGYEKLLNKQGLTWKQLDAETKATIIGEKEALQLLSAKNSMIKRPVLEFENGLVLGFQEEMYQRLFLRH